MKPHYDTMLEDWSDEKSPPPTHYHPEAVLAYIDQLPVSWSTEPYSGRGRANRIKYINGRRASFFGSQLGKWSVYTSIRVGTVDRVLVELGSSSGIFELWCEDQDIDPFTTAPGRP